MTHRASACLPRNFPTVERVLALLAVLLLAGAPVIDLAWSEPGLDESQAARCHLHANPGIASETPSCLAPLVVELPGPSGSLPRLHPISSSIFVPPRT